MTAPLRSRGAGLQRPSPASPPPRPSLSQQQSDYTAEGSPPPGRVAQSVPARPPAAPRPAVRKPPAKLPPARG